MNVGTTVFVVAVSTLIATCGLSGCSKQQAAATTNSDTRSTVAAPGDEHADHAAAHKLAHQGTAHGPHDDHRHHGHQAGHPHHRGGGHHDNPTAPQGAVQVGDKVPDFVVRTLDGKSVTISELQRDESQTKLGIVVLSFWCTTCHSCRDMEHLLARLCKEYAGQAAVIALAANADETAGSVAAFLNKNGLELPVVLDPSGSTADLFGVNRTTTTVVIDGQGVLRYCGQFQQEDGGSAEEALQAVLAGQEVAIKATPHYG
jgi:peroxiredoxin